MHPPLTTAATPRPSRSAASTPTLKEDEVIINPFFMAQLLNYGIMLGQANKGFEGEALDSEAMRLVRELQNVSLGVSPSAAPATGEATNAT